MTRLAVNATNYSVCLGTFFQARTEDILHGLIDIENVLTEKEGKKNGSRTIGMSFLPIQ